MGISAVAVLRISSEQLGKELEPAPEAYQKAVAGSAPPSALFFTGKTGAPFIASALADGVCIHTGASFASEPEELSAGVRAALGALLDEHHDPRGVFFFPDVAKAQAGDTYDALVERVGDAGQWAPVVSEEAAQLGSDPNDLLHAAASAFGGGGLGAGGLDALLGNVMSSLDPALMQQIAGAMFSGGGEGHPGQGLPDPAALAESVKAMMGGSGNLEAAMKKAQEMVDQNPELQELQKKLTEDYLRKGK